MSLRWILGLFLAVALVVGLPVLQRTRTARRRHAARTPAERVDTAWAEIAESLEHHHGVLRDASETRTDFCKRLAAQTRFSHLPLSQIGSIVTTARYAPDMVSADQAARVEAASDEISKAFRNEQTPFARWWFDANPRRLLKPTVRITVR